MNSSPTNSGPDSEAASVDDLPADTNKNLEAGYIPEDLTNKMAAATSYVGSFFNPSAWKPSDKSPEAAEGETGGSPRKNSAGAGIISSSLFSAIGKVQGFTKVSPTEETTKEESADPADTDKQEDAAATGGAGFFSAFSKIGMPGMTNSGTMENIAAGGKTPEDDTEENDDKKKETWGNSLSNAFNKVGKVATDYSKGEY